MISHSDPSSSNRCCLVASSRASGHIDTRCSDVIAFFRKSTGSQWETLATKLLFDLLESLLRMPRNTFSGGKLLEGGIQHTCGRLLLLGREMPAESYDSNIFPPSLIA